MLVVSAALIALGYWTYRAVEDSLRELRPQRVGEFAEAFAALGLEHRWTQREAQAWWKALLPTQ